MRSGMTTRGAFIDKVDRLLDAIYTSVLDSEDDLMSQLNMSDDERYSWLSFRRGVLLQHQAETRQRFVQEVLGSTLIDNPSERRT
jgi:hypothetical protein